MILELDDLFPRGEEVASFSLEGKPSIDIDDPGTEVTNVILDGTVTAQGKAFEVKGHLIFHYSTLCARCLIPVSSSAETEFQEMFRLSEDGDDSDWYPYKGRTLDLSRMIEDCIHLNMPFRTLCREDCRGICPVCGINRNTDSCQCEETQSPEDSNPFAMLIKMREENEEV